MPIRVQCKQCGKRFGAKDEWAGRHLKCPNCGETIPIPAPDASSPPPKAKPLSSGPVPARTDDVLLGMLGNDPLVSADPLASAPVLGNQPAVAPRGSAAARAKKGKSKTLWIVLGATGGTLLLACGGCMAILLPGIQAARKAARETVAAQAAREAQAQAGPPAAPTPPSTPAPTIPTSTTPVAATGTRTATPPASLPVWTADAELVKQLGPELAFDQYAWRLPVGYKESPSVPPPAIPIGRFQTWAWLGPAQLTGQQLGAMVVMLEYNQPPARASGDLEKVMSESLSRFQISGRSVAIQHEPLVRGTLGGKECVRTVISGADMGVKFHGVQFMYVEGRRMVSFNILSTEPPGSAAFKLVETAALTFHETQPVTPAAGAASQGAVPPPASPTRASPSGSSPDQ